MTAERTHTAKQARARTRTSGGPALATAFLPAALLLAVTAAACSSGPEPARPPTGRPAAGAPAASAKDLDTGDFNGDGYDDYAGYVVASSKGADKRYSTHLVIVYGSAEGLRPEWARHYTDVAGGELFRADLDGDGYTDLLAGKPDTLLEGTPYEKTIGAHPEQYIGATGARVWWGGPRGLSAPEDLAVPKDTRLMAVADFDGDGRTDLLDAGFKKSPYEPKVRDATDGRMFLGPYDREGAPARAVPLDLGQDGWATPARTTTGDFDGDGRAEVLLHYRCADIEDETAPPCLRMEMREGAADGGLPTDPALQAALDLQYWNGYGVTADVGDADGDGVDDLLLKDTTGGGNKVVQVFYGARSGLGTGRATATVGPGLGGGFGSPAAAGDMTGDGHPDLLISAPGFRNHDGRLTLVPGTSDGGPAPIDRATSMDSTTKGLPGTPNPYEWNDFTADPPLLDVNGDDHDDAVLFLPLYEKRKGMFLVVYGTDEGLDPGRTDHFSPADVGVSRSL